MNKVIRSFFSVLILATSVFVVGCGTTGNPVVDRAATYGALGAVAGNLATGNSEGAGKGAALGILFGALGGGGGFQQQQQFSQQQVGYPVQQGGGQNSAPCAPGFRQVGWQGAARVCAPAQQQYPQQHQYPQPRQCGMWAGDCNQQMRSPVIPAAPCRMVNVPVQFDQHGRPVAYQQRQQC